MKYYAVGMQAVWDSYTQTQKEFYNNNFFLSLNDAFSALPSLLSEDYTVILISSIDNTLSSTISSDLNNYTVYIDGNNYLSTTSSVICNYSRSDCDGHIIVQNFDITITNSNNQLVFLSNPEAVSLTVRNNTTRGGQYAYYYFNGTGYFNAYNNIIVNAKRGIVNYNSNNISNIARIYNNIIISATEYSVRLLTGQCYCGNNYLDGAATISGNGFIDSGGNYISDSNTAVPLESRNLSKYDAFVDPDNENFTPKEVLKNGVAPIIPGHTHYQNGVVMSDPYYVGAVGIENDDASQNNTFFKSINNKRRSRSVAVNITMKNNLQ